MSESLNCNSSGDTANLSPGRRRASVANATCISTRARLAHMPAGVAVDVESLWILNEFAIPVSGGQIHQQPLAGTDQLTADREVFGRDPIHLRVHDGEIAHELFDGVGDHR